MDLKEKLRAAKFGRRRESIPDSVAEALGLTAEDGANLFVAECSARDLDSFQAGRWKQVGTGRSQHAELDLTDERARLLVRCLVHASGSRIFTDEDVGDVAVWPASAADTLYAMALRLCGLTREAEEEAKKNGDGRPGG